MKRSVNRIKTSIRKVLQSEGLYSPVFDLAIEDLSRITYLKDIAFEDATVGFGTKPGISQEDVGGKSVVFENSREGDRRYKINPAYSIYIDLVRESQKMLDGLCMTAKSSNSVQDDEFEMLKNKMEKAANGEG